MKTSALTSEAMTTLNASSRSPSVVQMVKPTRLSDHKSRQKDSLSRVSGAVTGIPISSVAKGDEFLIGGGYDTDGFYYEYTNYSLGGNAVRGDSGAPVYTVPDADGNVRIVGILTGLADVEQSCIQLMEDN